jgi:hypothetical protein
MLKTKLGFPSGFEPFTPYHHNDDSGKLEVNVVLRTTKYFSTSVNKE